MLLFVLPIIYLFVHDLNKKYLFDNFFKNQINYDNLHLEHFLVFV